MSKLDRHDRYDRDFIAVILAVLLAIMLIAALGAHSCGATVAAEGPTALRTAPARTTAEIIAEVDARVTATVAKIDAKWMTIRAASLARVEARLAEIHATRTTPDLPAADGTWRWGW